MGRLEYIEYKGFLWAVKRIVHDRPGVNITAIKEACYADMCLRKKGLLYFVEIIEDVEIIEETKGE